MVIEKVNTVVLDVNDIDDAVPGFLEALCNDFSELARNSMKRFSMNQEPLSGSIFDDDRTIRNAARAWIEEQLRARNVDVPAFIFIEIDY